MINILHLLWIIPISTCFALFVMALLRAMKDDQSNTEEKNYDYTDI